MFVAVVWEILVVDVPCFVGVLWLTSSLTVRRIRLTTSGPVLGFSRL